MSAQLAPYSSSILLELAINPFPPALLAQYGIILATILFYALFSISFVLFLPIRKNLHDILGNAAAKPLPVSHGGVPMLTLFSSSGRTGGVPHSIRHS